MVYFSTCCLVQPTQKMQLEVASVKNIDFIYVYLNLNYVYLNLNYVYLNLNYVYLDLE